MNKRNNLFQYLKKIARILLVLLGIIFFVGLGIYFFRKQAAKKSKVDPALSAVIRISIDDILLENAPKALWKGRSAKFPKSEADNLVQDLFWDGGLEIPSTLYAYSLPASPLVFYSILSIDNSTKWKHFLSQKLQLPITDVDGKNKLWEAQSADKLIHLMFDEETLIIQVANSKIQERETLISTLTNKLALIAIDKIPEKNLKNGVGDIAYISMKAPNFINLALEDNAIGISGEWELGATIKTTPTLIRPYSTTEQVAMLWTSLPLGPLIQASKKVFPTFQWPIDSLENHVGNYLDIRLNKSPVFQTDTIIAYSYDDNFEPVELKEVQKFEVPNIEIAWKVSPHIAKQLPQKMFYQFNREQHSDTLYLHTMENKATRQALVSKPYAFYLNIAFDRWPKAFLNSPIPQLKKHVKTVELNATVQKNNKLLIEGTIQLAE